MVHMVQLITAAWVHHSYHQLCLLCILFNDVITKFNFERILIVL